MKSQDPSVGRPKHVAVFEGGEEAKKRMVQAMKAVVSVQPRRTQTSTHVIHHTPRISAAKLAEYAMADHSRQETIRKQSKNAPIAVIPWYQKTRDALPEAFGPSGIDPVKLTEAAARIDAIKLGPDDEWVANDNKRSAEGLRKIAAIAPMIDCANSILVPRPGKSWGGLPIQGVYVSVNPDMVFSFTERGVKKVGGVILNTGQGENLSLARGNGRNTVGDYLTTLLYMMLELRLKTEGVPAPGRCYAIDMFRSQVYSAPRSHKTLVKNLEAACRTISEMWASIPVSSTPEEEIIM
ncbi:MAG TPA: hypothetical protein VHD61_14675 [Lacunisphaera sp.]|nr:hypothetical protein [Lacunisphaera sp.]